MGEAPENQCRMSVRKRGAGIRESRASPVNRRRRKAGSMRGYPGSLVRRRRSQQRRRSRWSQTHTASAEEEEFLIFSHLERRLRSPPCQNLQDTNQ